MKQASAVPFRRRDGVVEYCLITTVSKGLWSFPKGIVDPGETLEQTALKEAFEEAGLTGRVVGDPLGYYEYEKWDTRLYVTVVLMCVDDAAEDWEEAHVRDRCWVEFDEARRRLGKPELLTFLERARHQIEGMTDVASTDNS